MFFTQAGYIARRVSAAAVGESSRVFGSRCVRVKRWVIPVNFEVGDRLHWRTFDIVMILIQYGTLRRPPRRQAEAERLFKPLRCARESGNGRQTNVEAARATEKLQCACEGPRSTIANAIVMGSRCRLRPETVVRCDQQVETRAPTFS